MVGHQWEESGGHGGGGRGVLETNPLVIGRRAEVFWRTLSRTDCRCAAGGGSREQLIGADAPHLPKPELFQAPPDSGR